MLRKLFAAQAAPASTVNRALAKSLSTRSIYDNDSFNPEHMLHCMFTRNNTILTLSRRVQKYKPSAEVANKGPNYLDQAALIDIVRPQQEVILTVSTGQLGFKGTKKSTYDAAFQTSARMFELMEQKGLLNKNIELVTRNFGQNRTAFFSVLFGKEGTKVRPLIKRVTDGTRIKFGGDRSPNKRRV